MNVMNLGPNDWVTCPFDPVHRMKYSRFHNHFVKCQKEHPDDNRKPCPYNASELIEIEDYESHISECPCQSLYFNVGQVTSLPEYDAPSHFTLGDVKSVSKKNRNRQLNIFSDSDDEFDSVSMTENIGYQCRIKGSLSLHRSDASRITSTENTSGPKFRGLIQSAREKSPEKKGFGRGAWIKQMLEQKKSLLENSVGLHSDGTSSMREDSSSRSSWNEMPDLIQQFKDDPFRISKEFGRGRGAIFRSLLND